MMKPLCSLSFHPKQSLRNPLSSLPAAVYGIKNDFIQLDKRILRLQASHLFQSLPLLFLLRSSKVLFMSGAELDVDSQYGPNLFIFLWTSANFSSWNMRVILFRIKELQVVSIDSMYFLIVINCTECTH